jgi:nicotinamidase-related amidase
MLLDRQKAALLVVDVQEKLLPAIIDHQGLLQRLEWLLGVAGDEALPVTFSEQYPRGLGHTVSALRQCAAQAPVVEKQHFSCVAAGCLPDSLLQRQKLILCGMETHVCVLQTALDLLATGKQVFVVADACGSRHALDHQLGLERMRSAGAVIVTREMVLFELLQQAGSAHFKEMSQRYLQNRQDRQPDSA